MAQTGYTPIKLYASSTASAVPSASNLDNTNGAELAINIADGKLFYKDSGGTVKVIAGTGGTGVVAGSNTQVQFNNNGVFGASSGLTWDGTNLTASQLRSSGLTSGRVTYASSSGLLVDSSNMTFNGTRLTVADLADSSLTAGRVTYATTGGNLTDSANLTFDGTTLTANALTVTNSTTLSAGTANGVAYLNGSKVVTTGTALQFDGTNLGLSTTLSSWGTDYRAIQIGGGGTASLSYKTSFTRLSQNIYSTNSADVAIVTGYAGQYEINDLCQHTWKTAGATAGNNVTLQTLMQLTWPASNQTTLTIGQGTGGSSDRNTILMAAGGFSDQPGNQNTGSNGDKMVLYAGVNRSAMGIGNDYNWWSQSKSFEWWISPTNLSTTVTKQLVLNQTALDFGVSNDSVSRRISVAHSTVPMYMSNSYDGTNGISTISNNIWNTSNGSYTWSSFGNTSYGAATIQLWSNTSGSYITMGAATAANTNPTGSFYLDRYGISAGASSYPKSLSGTAFANYISQANLNAVSSTNRVLAIDSNSVSGGSVWLGISGTANYAMDWSSTTWQRWVNVSGSWFNTHNLLKESGLEREEYNPGFIFEVAQGTSYNSAGWTKIIYDVSGGSRSLARDGNGYDTSNGRFTAPASGWYHFAAQISFSSSNDVDGTIKFLLNGSTNSYSPSSSQIGGNSYPGSRQLSGTMYLTEGDYVEVYCYFTGTINVVRGGQPYSGSFSGHFVG